MRRRGRRGVEVFSLSFLDAVCCGFGTIILLFVLNKMGEPMALEQAQRELQGLIARLEAELHEIRGETTRFDRVLRSREEQLSKETKAVARLRGDLTDIQGQYAASRDLSEIQDTIAGRLVAAQQELTEEMKRLQAERVYRRPPEAPVGAIPVDSEYIIFIIDTSGSMQRFAWPLGTTGSGSPTRRRGGERSWSGCGAGMRFRTRARWRGSRWRSGRSGGRTDGSACMSSVTSSREIRSTGC
jgi:hypothetical protein